MFKYNDILKANFCLSNINRENVSNEDNISLTPYELKKMLALSYSILYS